MTIVQLHYCCYDSNALQTQKIIRNSLKNCKNLNKINLRNDFGAKKSGKNMTSYK